jgi:hypothetical protein
MTMQYVCDAGAATWFRFESAGEAVLESRAMNHAVDKYFQDAYDSAAMSYVPPKSLAAIEQNIGRAAFIQKAMPMFLTLRDKDGTALVTAMLPPSGQDIKTFRPVIVGPSNADPYPAHGAAILALSKHIKMPLDPARCYPYKRG